MRGLESLGLGVVGLGDLETELGLRHAPLVVTGQGSPQTPIANGFVKMPKFPLEALTIADSLWPRA